MKPGDSRGRIRQRTRDSPHHVVIVGGGFGGLFCAHLFRRTPVMILDRRNFHIHIEEFAGY